jgi:hypothetical protein
LPTPQRWERSHSALDSLETITGTLVLDAMPALTSLSHLEQLGSVSRVELTNLSGLPNLIGLGQLQIADWLFITDCSQLNNLHGLEKVGLHSADIARNAALLSLDGISVASLDTWPCRMTTSTVRWACAIREDALPEAVFLSST